MRSEFPGLYPVTTAIMSPQIVGAVQDGDTMTGSGFVTNITVECECTTGSNASHIMKAARIGEAAAQEMLRRMAAIGQVGLVSHVENTNDSV
jgi:hypothetical protein